MSRAFAWAVHAYTASGQLVAAWMAVCIVEGGDAGFRRAMQLMALATFIDSTDGWLARRARVKEALPGFDGRRLDDIIDFQTYTALPLLLLWRAGIPSAGWAWVLPFAAVASLYGFSQTNAKTEDGYFLGFPSYWNVVAVYLYLLRPHDALAAASIGLLALLTFVPTRYLYPSHQGGWFAAITNLGAAVWGVLLGAILTGAASERWTLLSAAYPAYYLLASWWVELRFRSRRARTESALH